MRNEVSEAAKALCNYANKNFNSSSSNKINVPFWSHMPRVIIQQACQNYLANHELEEK